MRDLKADTNAKMEFWKNLKPNRHLRTINIEHNLCRDKVLSVISEYLKEPGIVLNDLNLAKNFITGKGIRDLSVALCNNLSLKKLNLGDNKLEDDGLDIFAASLS